MILAAGVWFLPFSPRLLVNKGKEEDARKSLSFLRNRPLDDPLVEVELLEIKAEHLFEDQAFAKRFPNMAAKSRSNPWIKEAMQYVSIFKKKDSFKRVAIAGLVMFFQQWSGIDSSKRSFPRRFYSADVYATSYLLCPYYLPVSRTRR